MPLASPRRADAASLYRREFEALSRAVALPTRPCLLAVDASHLQPKPDDLCDVDRKQHGVKKKDGIKLSCDAVEDE